MMRMKKVLSAALLCLMLWLILPMQALAVDAIDPNHDVSLTIRYEQDGKMLAGAMFAIYRVADVSEQAKFTASGDFAAYKGVLNGLENADEWDKLAQNLVNYTKNSTPQIQPIDVQKTNSEGLCDFDSSALTPGLYLVVGHDVKVGNTTYTCKPFVISLPNPDAESQQWDYHPVASPKAGTSSVTPTPPDNPPPEPPEELPQTGVLWWPVPVLLCLGVISLIIGVIRRRRCGR